MNDAKDERSATVPSGRGSILLLAVLGVSFLGYALSDDSFLGSEAGFGRAQQILASAGAGLLLATLLPRRWRQRIAAAVVTTAAMVALLEILLRPSLVPALFTPVVPDAELIFTLSPGRQAEHLHDAANGGGKVRYSINEDGYRGKPLPPPGSAWRVAVFGDSFIEARFTPEAATFCARLEQELATATGVACEVVNCGVAAYGPDQCLLKLRRELGKLRPDLVVFSVFTGNDFGDLQRNKLFRIGPDGRLQKRDWQLAEDLRSRLSVGYRESALLRLLRRSLRRPEGSVGHDALTGADGGAALLRHLLETATAEHADYHANDIVSNIAWDYFNADCSLTPDAASARSRRDLMACVLDEVRATTAGAGLPCLVLSIPYVLDVCPTEAYRVDPLAYPGYDPQNLRRALDAACRSAGLPSFDLFDTLRDREHFMRGWDDHWSEAGQAAAARALAQDLERRQWLPRKRV